MAQAPTRNLLDMCPRRAREWRDAADGRVAVFEPRYGSSALGRWLAARSPRPHIEVKLDAFGSATWRLCDGETPVRRLVQELREEFGAQVEPVEERLADFLRSLERARLIRWR